MYQSVQQLDATFSSTPIATELQSQLNRLFRCVERPGHLTFRIALDSLMCSERRTFEFREPIELSFSQDEGVWSCEACGIVSTGSDPTEAALSFCEDFGVCWDEVAQVDDEFLATGARKMKQCMLSTVKSVR